MTAKVGPYGRDRQVDKPGIAGARWWHDALADQDAQIARRAAIRNILIAGGVIAGFGAMLAMCIKAGASTSSSSDLPSDVTAKRETSLDLQKSYGWSFGANTEPLVFNGQSTEAFKPGAILLLGSDLAPDGAATSRYAQSTLFDAPNAYPSAIAKLDPDEQAGFQQLSAVLKPIHTPAMDSAYGKGKALAGLFSASASSPGPKAILLVDLNGPATVAFAAGAAEFFQPVFLFDNWPHPRGVVRAHETLSAAIYYQPRFAATKKARSSDRPAMFVLDRNRLTTYTDDATQFDNRWIAKLPLTAPELTALGASHVLYVCPERTPAPFDLDDVNDELVVYAAGGIDVKALSLDLFTQETDISDGGVTDPAYYYGGSHLSHHAFFVDYPWAKPVQTATARPAANPGKSYVPVARTTPYSFGSADVKTRTRVIPPSFATVPVIVAVGTGVILGARYSRSGSWNRSSSSWSGG